MRLLSTKRLLTLALLCLHSFAYAFTISNPKADCNLDTAWMVPSATFSFGLNVDEDAGNPGLVYLAMVDPAQRNAYFFQDGNTWVKWDGGMLPMFSIERDGVESKQISVNLGRSYRAFAGFTLYVGYGLHHPEMEDVVQKRREGLNKAHEMFPQRSLYDPGDDYMRRALIERELKDTQRYKAVMTIQCPNTGIGGVNGIVPFGGGY